MPGMTAESTITPTTAGSATESISGAPTTHQGILDWVAEIAALTQPADIHWCTGSDEEWPSSPPPSRPPARSPG